MPLQQSLPTWTALNNANFPVASGIQDSRTGQEFPVGGLNLGDYFDVTEREANNQSALSNGLCHWGRYRLVQVDSGATAANVKTGTVGFLRAGTSVSGVVITNAGTGATNGSYTIAATPGSGGGSGASIQVVVSGGLIVSASVVTGGVNYVSVPTFPMTVTGTTGGTVAGQLNSTPNLVTSFDQAPALVHPVVFLNPVTPGNFGFVQEGGLATVLGNGTIGTAALGAWVNVVTAGGGTVNGTAASGGPTGSTIGQAVDLPVASNLFKIVLNSAPVQD
jgi:hypothetical protein